MSDSALLLVECVEDLLDVFEEAVGITLADCPWDNRCNGSDQEEEDERAVVLSVNHRKGGN